MNHGDTEDTEHIDLLGEPTGKTLSDLRDSVLPLLRSEEFDTGFSYSPRPLRSRRFYPISPGAVLGIAEIAEAPQGERTFGGKDFRDTKLAAEGDQGIESDRLSLPHSQLKFEPVGTLEGNDLTASPAASYIKNQISFGRVDLRHLFVVGEAVNRPDFLHKWTLLPEMLLNRSEQEFPTAILPDLACRNKSAPCQPYGQHQTEHDKKEPALLFGGLIRWRYVGFQFRRDRRMMQLCHGFRGTKLEELQ